MVREGHYLFNCSHDINAVVTAIEHRLGCRLWPQTSDRPSFVGTLLGFDVWVDYNDEADPIRSTTTESLRYRLTIATSTNSLLDNILVETLALIAYSMHDAQIGVGSGMLVSGARTLLARYENRDNRWVDTLSETAVAFPEHLSEIKTRLQPFERCGHF